MAIKAPKGYKAVKSKNYHECIHCDLLNQDCSDVPCNDGQDNYVFKKIQKENNLNELTNEKTMTTKEVAEALGVTVKTVCKHAQKLGLTRNGVKTLITEKQATEIKNEIVKSGRSDLNNVVKVGKITTETEENDTILKALSILKARKNEYKKRAEIAETKCIELQPKADYADLALKAKTQLSITDAGKIMQIRQSNMFGFVRFKRLLTTKGVPSQKSLDMNILTLKQYVINTDDGPVTKDSACMTMQNINNFKQIYLDTGKFAKYLCSRKNEVIKKALN